ncbi:MAG: U32 family peptidase, partial [Gammaproteobacteria bacterium]|nr:U32 family peptidase [Gammaproteobacteria bacterium]
FEDQYAEVTKRLTDGGKKVVLSTLSEVMIDKDRQLVSRMVETKGALIEANDASALWHLEGRAHRIGPYVNVYNEKSMAWLAGKGAEHFCLNPELPKSAVLELAQQAQTLGVGVEVQVFGRISLALSARCYHARAHDRVKDNCQFVCEESPDGMELDTVDGDAFLAVNGIQTLSHPYVNLMQEMPEMAQAGVSAFRLSPHDCDMVKVCRLFGGVSSGRLSPDEGIHGLQEAGIAASFCNGFSHGVDGYRWVANS